MAYLSLAEEPLSGLGCGASCSCKSCRTQFSGFGETYEVEEPDAPAATSLRGSGFSGFGETPCPVAHPLPTTDRCVPATPHPCPPLPTLICASSARGAPFEAASTSLADYQPDPRTGLLMLKRRPPRRASQQRFIPAVMSALESFVDNMRRFGLPIDAILTAGSLNCRCITNKNVLSNHSFGDAFDVVGVRWPAGGASPSRLLETVVRNFRDMAGERILLRRINACLRLSFAVVIDYHHRDHDDHFHCDMNRGRGRILQGATTVKFVQEALENVLGRPFPLTGRFDATTEAGLREFAHLPAGTVLAGNRAGLGRALDQLFTFVASAGRVR
jgi:hypothetical protein